MKKYEGIIIIIIAMFLITALGNLFEDTTVATVSGNSEVCIAQCR